MTALDLTVRKGNEVPKPNLVSNKRPLNIKTEHISPKRFSAQVSVRKPSSLLGSNITKEVKMDTSVDVNVGPSFSNNCNKSYGGVNVGASTSTGNVGTSGLKGFKSENFTIEPGKFIVSLVYLSLWKFNYFPIISQDYLNHQVQNINSFLIKKFQMISLPASLTILNLAIG